MKSKNENKIMNFQGRIAQVVSLFPQSLNYRTSLCGLYKKFDRLLYNKRLILGFCLECTLSNHRIRLDIS